MKAEGIQGSRDTVGKRLFDACLSAVLLVVLAPLFLLISVVIKLSSPGPVFYRQTRVGKGGRPFAMWKFRSMVRDADQIGPWYTDDNDPRVTPVGRFLRLTSLDELPQLFNVLRGDMSVVGPRPDVPAQLGDYTEEQRRIIFNVRPGITGLAQVMGRSELPAEARKNYNLHYALHRNFWLDLEILVRTVWVAASRRGTN